VVLTDSGTSTASCVDSWDICGADFTDPRSRLPPLCSGWCQVSNSLLLNSHSPALLHDSWRISELMESLAVWVMTLFSSFNWSETTKCSKLKVGVQVQ